MRRLDGSEPARVFRNTRYEAFFPTFSPDAAWLAYESNETGRAEVYVEAFPGPGARHQLSADGGTEPLWGRNGELFYRSGREIRIVRTQLGERFEFTAPETLFTVSAIRSASERRTYDVTSDGQRFLMVRTPDATAPRRIDRVTNWLDDLKERVPLPGK